MAVVEAAGARLRAETDQDADAARAATETLLSAATSAMSAGFSLSEIAAAEARGKADIRSELCPDTLRRVERSARHAREAEREHHRMIARAMRLGLSTREIAVAAGVTHGTVRAIASRLAAAASSTDAGEDQPPEPPGEGDSSDG
jgi:DNA-binding NarL/FixJ family response regulator